MTGIGHPAEDAKHVQRLTFNCWSGSRCCERYWMLDARCWLAVSVVMAVSALNDARCLVVPVLLGASVGAWILVVSL
jgi:hypothetical protein